MKTARCTCIIHRAARDSTDRSDRDGRPRRGPSRQFACSDSSARTVRAPRSRARLLFRAKMRLRLLCSGAMRICERQRRRRRRADDRVAPCPCRNDFLVAARRSGAMARSGDCRSRYPRPTLPRKSRPLAWRRARRRSRRLKPASRSLSAISARRRPRRRAAASLLERCAQEVERYAADDRRISSSRAAKVKAAIRAGEAAVFESDPDVAGECCGSSRGVEPEDCRRNGGRGSPVRRGRSGERSAPSADLGRRSGQSRRWSRRRYRSPKRPRLLPTRAAALRMRLGGLYSPD